MTAFEDGISEVGVRPYARLLTMLGEQLIKNDRVALVVFAKNSYDADATRVSVDYLGFDEAFQASPASTLAITDNGDGMTYEVITEQWLNPATPGKQHQKKRQSKTRLGRVMQGEKGIGRFAIFKLGSRAKVITRATGSEQEYVLDYDLTFLDTEEGRASEVFLDQVRVGIETRSPLVFDGLAQIGGQSTHGVRIEITGLRSKWSINAVRAAYNDLARLQPLVTPRTGVVSTSTETSSFSIDFLRDGMLQAFSDEYASTLTELFQDRAVLKVDGYFDEGSKRLLLDVNGVEEDFGLDAAELRGLRVYKRYFDRTGHPRDISRIECGSFDFVFYVFDISNRAPIQYRLDSDHKAMVREHRIYLYRDGVRVLPYGDAEDDWLQLDIIRGTQSASQVLSNDQTVGFVHISQQANPKLKDKTNREGLLETGFALSDFIGILQLAIAHVRAKYYAQYLTAQAQQGEIRARAASPVTSKFADLETQLIDNKKALAAVSNLRRSYEVEVDYLKSRSERTEDLAGVGLSVEAASHDIIASANRALRIARTVRGTVTRELPHNYALLSEADAVVDLLSFVASRLQDIQGLFVSTRQSKHVAAVEDYVHRVERMFSSATRAINARVQLEVPNAPLTVSTTDAALLQVLINFFDNAIYWLDAGKVSDPRIVIRLDSQARTMIFADNGPGVHDDDVAYIFEPFYSRKGDAGKGLGLYIARQVGARSGFSVDLITSDSAKIAPGANFRVTFGEA